MLPTTQPAIPAPCHTTYVDPSENPQIPVPKVFGHTLTERRPEVVNTRFKLEIKDIGQFYMHRCPRHSRALCIVLHVEISIA